MAELYKLKLIDKSLAFQITANIESVNSEESRGTNLVEKLAFMGNFANDNQEEVCLVDVSADQICARTFFSQKLIFWPF